MTRVIQAASGAAVELLNLSRERHENIFGEAFESYLGTPFDWPNDSNGHPWPATWLKVYHLARTIRAARDGDVLLWLDADALVEVPFDPEQVLSPGYDAAAVLNVWGAFNVGVLFIRVGPRARRVLRECVRLGPVLSRPAEDQIRLNEFMQNGALKTLALSSAFNYYQHAARRAPEPLVYVRAWHGAGVYAARVGMKEALNAKAR